MDEASDERTYEIAGRTVTMPCNVRDASAGTVTFDADLAAARTLVPDSFEVVETDPGRCQVTIAIVDYRDNDLGDYDEIAVTFFVRPAGRADGEVGTYVQRMPVDQAFTCEAGRVIWGFPKTVEDIALLYAERSLTATLMLDGELAFRLTLPRGGSDEAPALAMTTYTLIDGVPHATGFSQGGTGAQVTAGGAGVSLELGKHPVAKELESLGLTGHEPLFTTWTEHVRAVFAPPEPLG